VSAWRARGTGLAPRIPGWRSIAGLVALAGLASIPIDCAYGHQLDTMRPPELMFAYRWLHPSRTPVPADEHAAIEQLRAAVDPSRTSQWLDAQYPLVRAAASAEDAPPAPAVLPDIILFAVESLRGADVGFVPGNYAPGESPTPNLDRLAQRGVVFSRYISNGNPSPRGFFAIQTGVWDHRESFNVSGSTETEFDALPRRLRRLGYYNIALWGANPSFDNQLFWANKWYDRLRYPDPAGRFVILRPLADDVVMDQLIDEIAAHDRERPGRPIFAYVASGGTHDPYVIQGETRLPDSVVKAIAAEPEPRRRYRMVLRDLDSHIGRVLARLEQRKHPAIIVVIGDHGDPGGEPVPPEMRGLPHDGTQYTAGLIVATHAAIGPVPRVDSFPASHVDLTPTLLRLVGDHAPTVAMGTDLFADVPASQRTAVSISGQGYRLDRGGWSLFVRRDHPEVIHTKPIAAPVATFRDGVEGSPFTRDDARRLWENMNTWSYLLERDRVWRADRWDEPR
jgi:arylsulfatase A-like enzyme